MLNSKDYIKGLIVAVITSVLTVLSESLSAGDIVIDFKNITTVALTATIAYLLKNLGTNEDGDFLRL